MEPLSSEALGLEKALAGTINFFMLDMNHRLIGASADGAVVNFGKNKGVLSMLTNDIPWLIWVHRGPST